MDSVRNVSGMENELPITMAFCPCVDTKASEGSSAQPTSQTIARPGSRGLGSPASGVLSANSPSHFFLLSIVRARVSCSEGGKKCLGKGALPNNQGRAVGLRAMDRKLRAS
jgi:hypothetical protein